ncbi:MAG: DUF4093 domain-containing protein [Evtepia sp.]
MLRIREAIVVEGKYDKNTLSQLVDTVILETSGFHIFKNTEQLALLRRIAAARGLVILTDSDGAGFVIRNFLKGAIPQEQVKHAYIPDLFGKEQRKRSPAAEGKLGVEGMSPAVLENTLRRAGVTVLGESPISKSLSITKTDLFSFGLTGTADSAKKRRDLLLRLHLPEHMTTNALLPVLNALYTKEEFVTFLSNE